MQWLRKGLVIMPSTSPSICLVCIWCLHLTCRTSARTVKLNQSIKTICPLFRRFKKVCYWIHICWNICCKACSLTTVSWDKQKLGLLTASLFLLKGIFLFICSIPSQWMPFPGNPSITMARIWILSVQHAKANILEVYIFSFRGLQILVSFCWCPGRLTERKMGKQSPW